MATNLIGMEIDKIINTKNTRTNTLEYIVILHTPKQDIRISLVESVEVLRDYNSSVTDYGVVSFYIGAGDFIKEVQQYRSNLEITIIERNISTDESNRNRYGFVILNNQDNIYGSMYTKMSKEELNKAEKIHIEGQYVLREFEAARTVYCDTTFRDTNVKNVLTAQFVNKLSKLKIEGLSFDIRCDVVEPNNDYLYRHIIIPNGTKLLSLPIKMQDKNYGVYSTGLGSYMQRFNKIPTVFVYPLYDRTRFDKTDKKLIVYYTNNINLNYVENTYMVDGDIVKMIAGTDIQTTNSGENDLKDSGDGIVGSNPGLLTRRNVAVDDGSISYSMDNQMSGSVIKKREDGLSNPTYIGNEPNQYKHRTAIVKKTMCYYYIPWRFPNIDLIYPGMPVSFRYQDESNGIIDLRGQVQSTYSKYSKATNTTVGVVNIMVEKPSFSKNL